MLPPELGYCWLGAWSGSGRCPWVWWGGGGPGSAGGPLPGTLDMLPLGQVWGLVAAVSFGCGPAPRPVWSAAYGWPVVGLWRPPGRRSGTSAPGVMVSAGPAGSCGPSLAPCPRARGVLGVSTGGVGTGLAAALSSGGRTHTRLPLTVHFTYLTPHCI